MNTILQLVNYQKEEVLRLHMMPYFRLNKLHTLTNVVCVNLETPGALCSILNATITLFLYCKIQR